MQLIILAAGCGKRMGQISENVPKPLLELKKGITILDRQLESAKKSGIKNVCVVVGFQADKIKEKIRQRGDSELNVETLYNPLYATCNNLVSLWTALSATEDDFILLNGDNVFRLNLLGVLNGTTVEFGALVTKKPTYDEDDAKLMLKDNRIIRLGKDIPLHKTDAEWVGMCVARGKARKSFVDKVKDLVRKPELLDESLHYFSALQGMADDGVSLETIWIEPGAWAEVDYQKDLDFVRNNMGLFDG